MNEEIKEILTDLEKNIYSDRKEKKLSIHQQHLLLDCIASQGITITNLQNENKELKEKHFIINGGEI